MQGDAMSRFFAVTVTDNGSAYTPPADAIYTVRFGGAPGMPSGWYDTITEVGGSSRPAVVVDETTYTVEIAEQALGSPGTNGLVLIISDATGYTLASWTFELDVRPTPGLEAPAVTTYYNLLAEQVAQVLNSTGEAASSAAAAAQSAAEAQQSATQAASSAAAAAQSAAEAQQSATQAASSASAAAQSATQAASSASAAAQSATQAASSASAAAQSASSADSNASAAAQSAQSATASASSASQSKTAAAASASQAQQSATQAGDSAVLAESWAVGGTGTRRGEDTNNAQHWAEEAQRVSQGALGWYETEQALQSAHPTGQNGEWAIIGSTDTIWTWDSDTGAWVDSGAQVDLSSYYTKAQADAAFATAAQGQKADSAVQPNIAFPVGYVFAWSPVYGGPDLSTPQKVADYFGFGTWKAFAAGRGLVGIDTSQTEFNTAGQTGGEKTHVLEREELPHVRLGLAYQDGSQLAVDAGSQPGVLLTFQGGKTISTGNLFTDYLGNEQPISLLQPYTVVYYWQRVA